MDLSTYWVLIQRHKARSGQLLLLLIVFIIGWRLGLYTSPYYQSTPIVFEDNACERSIGTTADLGAVATSKSDTEVAKQARADSTLTATPSESAITAPNNPQVAGSTEKAQLPSDKKYVGSTNSDLFHDLSCSASTRIKESNQIWFASVEEAKQAGYSPSKCTAELLGL
jgi:hypothetical protein